MNIEQRIQAAREHFSHPSYVLGNWQPFGPQHSFLNQYVSECLMTIMFAVPFYFLAASVMHLVYFHWFKNYFTPLRMKLRYEKETFYYDIKWSILNIIGQAPLVSLIKMGYPYSKIQYEFSFSIATVGYLVFHICYDEFLTYWAHRLLHHPKIYRQLHSIHHGTKAVTPFTGFAFHPLDAFIQAVPVFTSCYFVPIHINIVLIHAIVTSLWAFSIHDNVNMIPFKGILYAGSHSIHHFPWGQNYNYGKITSICDRLYGTYCDPQGITGYGYKPPAFFQHLIDRINEFFVVLIPDNGQKLVSKIRSLYSVKIE